MGEPAQDEARQVGADTTRGNDAVGPGTIHEITSRDPEIAKGDPNVANALIVARLNRLIEETEKSTKATLLLAKSLQGDDAEAPAPKETAKKG